MNIGKRISDFLNKKHATTLEASKYLEVSSAYVSKLRSGTKQIGQSTISKLVNKYSDLNLNWLFTGKGNMLQKNNGSKEIIQINEKLSNELQKKFDEIENRLAECRLTNSELLDRLSDKKEKAS